MLNAKTSANSSGLKWLWVSLLVMAIDRISKYIALYTLLPYEPHPFIPFLNFTLAYNKGAAFSFLNNSSGWQMWLFGLIAVVVSVVLLIWLHSISHRLHWRSIAIALIIGGALGNLWDRTLYGHVIDFIDFYVGHWHFPVFNIADSAICVGAFMLLTETFFTRK